MVSLSQLRLSMIKQGRDMFDLHSVLTSEAGKPVSVNSNTMFPQETIMLSSHDHGFKNNKIAVVTATTPENLKFVKNNVRKISDKNAKEIYRDGIMKFDLYAEVECHDKLLLLYVLIVV